MKFNESQLEQAVIDLMQNEGYSYTACNTLHKEQSEVLLLNDLQAFLRSQYPELTPNEIQSVVRKLQNLPASALYQSNKQFLQWLADGFTLKRENAQDKDIHICLYSPKAGEKVKYGRRIILNVNPKTPPKHKVPNLDGQQIMDAKRILENEGLEVGRVTYKPDFSKDVVLEYYVNGRKMDSATVAKGYLVLVGTKVDLLVADGRGETDFDVPSMIGLSEEEAEEVANAHEISLHKTYDYKSKRPLGTVIWQNPPTHIGTVRKGANAGSYDSRERNKIRSGDVIDIRIAGNPSAEPMTPEELAEYERKKDSLERDIRFRDSKQMDDYYKKWKKEDKDKPKEKKDTKESKDKPKEKKDKKEEKVPEKK
ncbi:MAG: PASTA domain-containing protein [Bacteroidetes bacterium]|nr:MAG: PASTA domain-containing protein [Bacteroidota bacterium]